MRNLFNNEAQTRCSLHSKTFNLSKLLSLIFTKKLDLHDVDMKKFFRFIFAGCLNTVIGYGFIFSFMYMFEYTPELSNVLGYIIGTSTGYILHRRISFGSNQKQTTEFPKFVLVVFASFIVNMLTLVILIHIIMLNIVISQIISGVIYVLVSYVLNNYFVFKKMRQHEEPSK